MPEKFLTTLTNWVDGPSDDVSVTPYAMHSGQELWPEAESGFFLGVPVGSGGVYWTWTDTLDHGTVEFSTTLRVDGNVSTDAKNLAFQRLFSHRVLNYLDPRTLNEVYEFLVEIYSSQLARAKMVRHTPKPEYIGTFNENQEGSQRLIYHSR